jgi:NH3-dependent NAD+ synthetase
MKILQEIIDYKKPTDGLGVSAGGLEQLGMGSYKEVDNILKGHFKAHNSSSCGLNEYKLITDHPIIKRFFRTKFKRLNPINIERTIILNEGV